MPIILHIETSTDLCSVALAESGVSSGAGSADDTKVLYSFISDKKNEHSSTLLLYIEDALKQTGVAFKDLSAVAAGIGPGSYTGLRIGAATAKGLAYALNIPVIGVSPLRAMANSVLSNCGATTQSIVRFVPLIDAGRMEVYSAVYDHCLNEIMPPQALILTSDTFADFTSQHTLVFFGSGSEKFRNIMTDSNFIDGIVPAASLMIPLAAKEYAAGNFLNTAYFEPLYIKEFIAKAPSVKGLQ